MSRQEKVEDDPSAAQRPASRGAAAGREHWEAQLLRDIRACHLPEPTPQYRFHPQRMYRADLAYPDARTMLLIEVDGGIWLKRGGHTTGAGYERDRVRDAEALALGWTVLRVTAGMVERGEAVRYIERALHMLWRRNGRQVA